MPRRRPSQQPHRSAARGGFLPFVKNPGRPRPSDLKGPLLRSTPASIFLGMRAAVAASTPASTAPSTACITAICAAEILSLLGYSIVPALLPQIIDRWSLSSTEGGWLAGIISGGYMLGVLPLVAATDRIRARSVYLASAGISAVASFGLAFSDSFAPALFFRALTGLGLAGMYMPGLRALTDGIDGPHRARVAALYTSSFTIGTALSFLLGRAGVIWGWRTAFLVSALASVVGLALAWAMLPRSEVKPRPARR
jgi:predicted MFS family arabinose efflux permease